MDIDAIQKIFEEKAEKFGARDSDRGNCRFRRDLRNPDSPYMGIIRREEGPSGVYSDYSLVLFPEPGENPRYCAITICVGTAGFRHDYENAASPWWRREMLQFSRSLRLRPERKIFLKASFDDISSPMVGLFDDERWEEAFRSTAKSFRNEIVAGEMLDSESADFAVSLAQWIGLYAILRQWPNADNERRIRNKVLPLPPQEKDQAQVVANLLERHRYVVLQGAPGTGKTFTANQVAARYRGRVLMTQFHAETTYSDFVSGLQPNPSGGFENRKGILLRAIDMAQESIEPVLLIIDEINRANLANVLGPVFYLLEKNAAGDRTALETENGKLEIPSNLHILATMNTADRSLAVVDFALRRRFVWHTLHPRSLEGTDLGENKFHKDDFDDLHRIFFRHATAGELALEPGHSYFIAPEGKMGERMELELMPLVREYLAEGYLSAARNALEAYFNARGLSLFE